MEQKKYSKEVLALVNAYEFLVKGKESNKEKLGNFRLQELEIKTL